jgi:hypothetical protein
MGKVQPLLVDLKQADQAKQLVTNAKRLRQSSVPETREKVFINPYLTRAEAAAAYQVRVQRRLAQQHRNERLNGGNHSDTNVNINSGNNNNPPLADLQSNRRPPLNPTADPFNPVTTSMAVHAI